MARDSTNAAPSSIGAVAYVARPRGVVPALAPATPDPNRLDMVWVPAGTFWMGSPEGVGNASERPRHRVRISRPLMVSRTPVTQGQWAAVLDLARERGIEVGKLGEVEPHFGGQPDSAVRPMESVSWEEARWWCDLLSALDGAKAVYAGKSVDLAADGYRLPTAAEWEYFARAGTTTRWSFGDEEAGLRDRAWFGEGSDGATHPVGTKAPNPWGLHDVYGNVWEWCEDAWDGKGYDTGRAAVVTADPLVTRGDWRVMRGGSWRNTAGGCRSACRDVRDPDDRYWDQGFRVVRPVAPRDG